MRRALQTGFKHNYDEAEKRVLTSCSLRLHIRRSGRDPEVRFLQLVNWVWGRSEGPQSAFSVDANLVFV